MNVDEFFTLFESEFYKIFSQFSKKILQQEVTTDLRDLLKTIAKKWEEDKLMKSVSEELISEHFLEINRLLNRWHHKESTPWGYVNDSIERAIKILKSIERASKNYSVSTQETIDKITNSWSKVDKNTQYAFSFEAQILLENIEEKNQSFPNTNDVIFEKFPPEFDVDDFCDFLENSLNVKIKDYKKEGNNLICTLFTPKDVQILCSEIISFRKTTLICKPFDQVSFGIRLSPINDQVKEKNISSILDASYDITIDPSRIKIDSSKQIAFIQLNSLEEQKNLLKIGELTIRGAKVKIAPISSEETVCVYPSKDINLDKFINVWENNFGFSIKEKYEQFSGLIIKVPECEYKNVINQYISVSGEKIKIVSYTPFRIKMLKVPTFVFENEQIISNSISKVISLDSLICFVILPQTSQGYIHLKDNESKTKLLNSKSLILQYNAPSNDNNANKNYPLDEKETKFKLEEETPNNPLCYKFIIYQVPSNKEFRIELVKVLQRISGKIFFNLLFRDGNIYIELHSNAPNFSLQPIKIKDKIYNVTEFEEEIPYFKLILEPIPQNCVRNDIIKALNSLNNYERYGPIEISRDPPRAIISILSEENLKFLLSNIKSIKIGNMNARFSDPNVKEITGLGNNEITYLKLKKSGELKDIKTRFSVDIKFEGFEKQKNKNFPEQEFSKQLLSIQITGTPENIFNAEREIRTMVHGLKKGTFEWTFPTNEFLLYGEKKLKSLLHNDEDFHEIYSKFQFLSNKPDQGRGQGRGRGGYHHSSSYYEPSTLLQIKLCGPENIFENAFEKLKLIRNAHVAKSIRIKESFKGKLNINELEKEYEVKILSVNDRLDIFGEREAISSISQFLEHDLVNNFETSMSIKLSKGESLFFQKFFKSKLDELRKQYNLKSILIKQGIVIAHGTKNILDELKENITALRNSIKLTTEEKTLDQYLATGLQNYLEHKLEKVIVIVSKKKDSNLTKENLLKLTGESKMIEDEEESEDFQIRSSEFSSIHESQLSSIDDEEEGEILGEEKQKRKTKFDIDVSISIWHLEEIVKKVKATLAQTGSYKKILTFPMDRFNFIKNKLRFDSLKKEFLFITVLYKSRRLVLKSFNDEVIKNGVAYINKLIEKDFISTDIIKLNENQYQYLKSRKNFLQSVKREFNLQKLLLDDDGKFKKLNIGGSPVNSHKAKEFINLELENLQQISLKYNKKFVDKNLLKEIKEDLIQQYPIAITITDRDEFNYVKIIASSPVNMDEIKDRFEKLKPEIEYWNPSNYADLVKLCLIQKKINLTEFKNQWNLSEPPHFDKEKQTIKLCARNKEDIDGAKQALEALLENKKYISNNIALSQIQSKFLKEYYKKELDQIEKSTGVKIFLNDKGKNKSLIIRGTNDVVQQALNQVTTILNNLKASLKIKRKEVSQPIYNELMKNKYELADEIWKSGKVYIHFPETDQNKILLELSLKKSSKVLQIVQGDILKENSDCIVNPANERLQHIGGLAAHIAKKAGQQVIDECEAYIQTHSVLNPGYSMLTSSGNLKFKGIIHTVGPVWHGGYQREKELLKNSINSVLNLGTQSKFESISVPSISSGIFGFPKSECARILIQTSIDFLENINDSSIKSIRFCDNDSTMLTEYMSIIKEYEKLHQVQKISSMDSSFEVAYQWSWRENNGEFVDFDPDQNYQIEVAYVKQNHKGKILVTGDLNKVKNKFSYEVDFDQMTEINTHFRSNPRPIRRTPKVISSNFIWEVNYKNQWVSLGSEASKQLELAFQKKQTIPFLSIIWNNTQVSVYFNDFTLKTHSGNIYKVKRRELNYEDDMKNYLNFTESNTEIKLDEEEKNEFSIKNVIELYFRNTEPGEEFFDKKIKDLETSINLQFPSILNDEKLKEINNISKKNFVEIKINPKNDGAILIGLTDSISAARQEILEYLVNNLASTNKFTFPSTWEPQTANCELKSISPNSSEWQQIELRMKETLPNIRISKLERVQNKWLWEKYQSSKAILEKKNQGNVNEKQLFHGTRANQPNNIFNDEYGFDMRFSSGGMWGVAIYFAQNASYSNSYRYTTPDNQYQMFFARVLVGDCIHIMPNDSSLKKPPSKQTVSGLGFTENYDSVSGETGGSKVYMIYENGRAYPEYLITYQ